MADEKTIVNGEQSEENQPAEYFNELDQSEKEAELLEMSKKIEVLERGKQALVEENEEIKHTIKKLTISIEVLKNEEVVLNERLGEMEREIDQFEDGKQASEVITARAMELQTEISKLQHDLISTTSETEEANAEIVELKRILGEKGEKIENLEREVGALKKVNAESEKKVRGLERKIEVLEVREVEEKGKKVRVKEEMREKIDEKEKEIIEFGKKVEELESVIVKNRVELEKWIKEKFNVEKALRQSEEETKAKEIKMVELKMKVEEAEKLIRGLKEKAVETVNGTANEIGTAIDGVENRLKLHWPVVAGSSGAIVVAIAVIYVFYARRN